MKINKQIIYGGNQQFADKIINHGSNLSEIDKQLINLIDKDIQSNTDKQELVETIEQLKSSETSTEEKEKAKGFLKKIFETSLTEATKVAVKALIENAPDYLDIFI